MYFIIRIVHCVLVALLVAACGGGGGGGSSDGSSASTGMRVLHGAIDAVPVDLFSDVSGVVQTARFGQETRYAELQVGAQNIRLTGALNSSESLFSSPVTVGQNNHLTLLLYGDRGRLGLRTALFTDGLGELGAEMSAVRVIHAVNGPSNIDAVSDAGNLESGIPFGSSSSYAQLPSGARVLTVRGNQQTLVNQAVTLEPGKAYTFFVTGEVNYSVHAVLLQD